MKKDDDVDDVDDVDDDGKKECATSVVVVVVVLWCNVHALGLGGTERFSQVRIL